MRRDDAYVLDMLDSARLILQYVEGRTLEDFRASVRLRDQVIRWFQVMGEVARRVSDWTKAELPGVPWRAIVGLRDILVHEYAEVNVDRLWVIVRDEIPSVVRVLNARVPPPDAS